MAKGKKERIRELLLEQRELEKVFILTGRVRIRDLDAYLYDHPEVEAAYDRWNEIEDELGLCFNEKTVREVRKWI